MRRTCIFSLHGIYREDGLVDHMGNVMEAVLVKINRKRRLNIPKSSWYAGVVIQVAAVRFSKFQRVSPW